MPCANISTAVNKYTEDVIARIWNELFSQRVSELSKGRIYRVFRELWSWSICETVTFWCVAVCYGSNFPFPLLILHKLSWSESHQAIALCKMASVSFMLCSQPIIPLIFRVCTFQSLCHFFFFVVLWTVLCFWGNPFPPKIFWLRNWHFLVASHHRICCAWNLCLYIFETAFVCPSTPFVYVIGWPQTIFPRVPFIWRRFPFCCWHSHCVFLFYSI